MLIRKLQKNGFTTEFHITQDTLKTVQANKIKIEQLIPDSHTWFDMLLLEIIDENKDGIADERFGKDFKVFFHGIITRFLGRNHETTQDTGMKTQPVCDPGFLIVKNYLGTPLSIRQSIYAINGISRLNDKVSCVGIIQDKIQ